VEGGDAAFSKGIQHIPYYNLAIDNPCLVGEPHERHRIHPRRLPQL
jgi:hypothetical protein